MRDDVKLSGEALRRFRVVLAELNWTARAIDRTAFDAGNYAMAEEAECKVDAIRQMGRIAQLYCDALNQVIDGTPFGTADEHFDIPLSRKAKIASGPKEESHG